MVNWNNVAWFLRGSKTGRTLVEFYPSACMVLAFLVLTFPLLAGGGWPQPKGYGYFKLSEWWIVADQHYTDAGRIDPNITNGLFNTNLYAEYGFTDRLTGILFFPLFSRNYFNNEVSGTTGEVIKVGEDLNSIGDANLGFKYGLTKPGSAVAISTTLTLGLPLGESAGGTEGNLQTGDGEFNQMLQVDAGVSFGSSETPLYANAFFGANNRTNDFSDELRYGIEFGAGLANQKLWLIGRVQGITSLKNGKEPSEVSSASIFSNNAEILNAGAEVNYYLTKMLGISAGFAAPLSGEIIFAAPAYTVGVFYDMKK
ncbi:MAG: hypothetical protein OEQ53_02915 [Saprospiraceae bacterium]|nr:hypothetical protein [Saprospiraceae bacterium]